jgi:methylated-DNA-[protein]-cysteine S-methyltransferase
MNPICYLEHPSPVGPLRIAASSRGLVAIHMERQRHMPEQVDPTWRSAASSDRQSEGILHAARRQLDEYFAGRRRSFDLPLDAEGTGFQKAVWQGLLTIGYGETLSYGGLARRIGREKAVRAVGLANGRNPLSIVVPCHRVIGADGTMTGYGGGIERKIFLLDHEARGDGAGRDAAKAASAWSSALV